MSGETSPLRRPLSGNNENLGQLLGISELAKIQNPLSAFFAHQLDSLYQYGKNMINQVIWDAPKIGVAVGLGVAANYFAGKNYPVYAAAAQPVMEGAVHVAKFVGLAFLFKSALTPYLNEVLRSHESTRADKLQATAVRYLCPMMLTLIAAHVRGIPVKMLESTGYTVGLFALIKLLGEGLKAAINEKGSSFMHERAYGVSASKKLVYRLIWKFPVMCFFTGMGIAANTLAGKYYPTYVASTESLNVAKFAGLAFLFKTILAPYLKNVITDQKDGSIKDKLHATAVRYINPMAITVIAAHLWGLKVKNVEGTLYTLGLFALIKLLGTSLEAAVNTEWLGSKINKFY